MGDFVTLTCPSCGSKLQVGKDLVTFACGYCGNELVVRRSGGIVSLAPVVEGLNRVERAVQHVDVGIQRVGTGVDSTASELALQRLRQDLDSLEGQLRSIEGEKSRSLGLGIVALTLSEIAFSSDSQPGAMILAVIGTVAI